MCPELSRRSQSGAGLPVALFIITVLSMIVLGMSQVLESSGGAVSLQIQSQRAFYAAESGAQIAVRDVLENDSCGAVSTPMNFGAGALSDCNASLTCGTVTVGSETIFTIESTGQCGAGADQATRVIEVRVR